MPELPEVETTVRGIRKYLIGKKIVDVWTNYGGPNHVGKDHIKNTKFFKSFKKKVVGAEIIDAQRRAKNILIQLNSGDTILVHMKMTGHLMYGKYLFDKKDKKDPWKPAPNQPDLSDPYNRFIRFVITFSDLSHLVLSDVRKFAKVTLIPTDKISESIHTKNLGPEPLEISFDLKKFKERLVLRPNLPIKSALMDQELIAGIGNIYSDEILWRSDVHPESNFLKIPEKQIKMMFESMKIILKKGIEVGGDSMSDYRNIEGKRGRFQVQHEAYRRKGLICRKRGCGGTITRKVIRTRSAHFCDRHQKLYQ